jgi:multicomponent Na+:H+ antiporter subunit E
MIGSLILRLTIWFLLTANFSLANVLIGVAVALLLPRSRSRSASLGEWLQGLKRVIIAFVQAYVEAFELLFRPHLDEDVVIERVTSGRSPSQIFLDVFLITFTPKTIVLNYREDGGYDVHRVVRRRPTQPPGGDHD